MLSRAVRNFWLSITGRNDAPSQPSAVIVHDPDAERPRDLDDPFFDPKVQSRMAEVIASSVEKKK
jgi:hypothetical protein